MDFTKYQTSIRKKSVKKMSVAEFIVFSREGFILLYPARFWMLSLFSMFTIILLDNIILRSLFSIVTIWSLYKTYEVIRLIMRLPNSTVFYDLEIKEDKIFGVDEVGQRHI